jgi:hypothetical protein
MGRGSYGILGMEWQWGKIKSPGGDGGNGFMAV